MTLIEYATADSTVSAWLGLIPAVQHTYHGFRLPTAVVVLLSMRFISHNYATHSESG